VGVGSFPQSSNTEKKGASLVVVQTHIPVTPKKTETDRYLIRQVVLYGIIGSGSAFLDFIIFTLIYKLMEMNEFLVNIISVHTGIAMSFTLNCRYNFKKTDRLPFRAASFYLTGFFGLALSQCLLWVGATLSLSIIMVKFISLFIVATVQFVMNKLITFGK